MFICGCKHIHTLTHALTHTHAHIDYHTLPTTHPLTHTHTETHTPHTHAHTHSHTCSHSHTLLHTHTDIQIHPHTHSETHTPLTHITHTNTLHSHTFTLTCSHRNTNHHTFTHILIHTLTHPHSDSSLYSSWDIILAQLSLCSTSVIISGCHSANRLFPSMWSRGLHWRDLTADSRNRLSMLGWKLSATSTSSGEEWNHSQLRQPEKTSSPLVPFHWLHRTSEPPHLTSSTSTIYSKGRGNAFKP